MSYSSVAAIVAERGLALTADNETALTEAVHDAIVADLPDGAAALIAQIDAFLAGEAAVTAGGQSYLEADHDPKSELGKQLMRICGTDVAREAFQRQYGVVINFLNCCIVLVSRQGLPPSWLAIRQVGSQATPDC
ncbi:hypothetical protein JNJ66_04680 [Candidatus Saccharibacteria bacterium]|nr:hypothetical protein [Candidatus Saccharibacteria bacterium]